MSEEEKSKVPGTCPVEMSIQMSIGMSHEKPCGRLIHEAPKGVDEKLVCLMHSLDPNKDPEEFVREIDDILNDESDYHPHRNTYNFVSFFFPEADFKNFEFTRLACFKLARFTQKAAFRGATFTQEARFVNATFTQEADFRLATFTHGFDLTETVFLDLADFSESKFEQPERVWFHQINKKSTTEFRARFLNCKIEDVSFEDVNWHREHGRMVLQDEIDIKKWELNDFKLVEVAYHQLIKNFEDKRDYDLAEECYVGAMEMQRIDPNQPRRVRWGLNIYKWASLYGSSYTRALWKLGILIGSFVILFSLVGLEPKPSEAKILIQVSPAWPNWLIRLGAGVLHAFEVATFQRNPIFTPVNVYGRIVAIVETVLIPGQLALLFLALRRRFRR